jgi:tetratricopeptide (TPR) repeat protein
MARQAEVSVQFYQEKLEANSQSLVFSRLADCFRKKGEIQQAIGVCMQGLQIHPDYVTGRIILGRCYLEQEKLKEATAEFVRVVELDRRNQVAIKMIADVYARQGMKEKAGDLYSLLLRMDFGNQSLEKLAQANRGNGETNVLRILGLSPPPPEGPASAAIPPDEERQAPSTAAFDSIADADKTIQMDIVAKQPETRINDTAQLGEMLVKTQKFDSEELTAPSDTADYRVEETVSDSGKAQTDGDTITGDDISSRMSMIFGEEEAKTKMAEPTEEPLAVVADDTDARTARDDTVAAGPADIGETVAAPVVSGSDITSRIEQLFGDEKSSDDVLPGIDSVSDFTQAYTPESAAQLDEGAVSVAGPAEEVEQPQKPEPRRDEQKEAGSQTLSGNDVTERLNEMFSDSGSDSIAEPLAEIGKMLDQHAPPIDEMEPAVPHSEMHDDLPTESIDIAAASAAAAPLDVPETLHGGLSDAVSGDDVALRLETIFEEGERTDDASDSDAISVHEDTVARQEARQETRPEEDTRPPVEFSDHSIVINGDLPDSEIDEMGEATMFGAEAPPEEPTAGGEAVKEEEDAVTAEDTSAGDQGMNIDDAVQQDEQPGMSGDDVVGRLDELFSDDLAAGSGGAESIPEGDKDDDVVNQGFYTMSGENAQTAEGSDEGMLSELDKQEIEDVEKTTSDIAHDDVEKTVLMDQDGGDATLAVTDEETILSDRRQPLSGQPGSSDEAASTADIDDIFINSATQISLPTAEADAAAQTQAIAGADANAQYSIPDHVLTPTLADIYYQQGQPKLALQIYNRLLDADPDNDKLAKRTREIQDFIASQEAGETTMMDSGKKNSAPVRPETAEAPARGAAQEDRKADRGRKPLSGVRIKKVFKSRIKKSR